MRVKGYVEMTGAVIEFDEEFDLQDTAFLDWINRYEERGFGPAEAATDFLNFNPPIVRVLSVKL